MRGTLCPASYSKPFQSFFLLKEMIYTYETSVVFLVQSVIQHRHTFVRPSMSLGPEMMYDSQYSKTLQLLLMPLIL